MKIIHDELKYKYRVTMVVGDLGWVDYHFGHSIVWPSLPGRGEFGRIGLVVVQDGGSTIVALYQSRGRSITQNL